MHPAEKPPSPDAPSASGLPESAPPPREWRHDLEGLRAVAILLVAAYHVWFHRVSGGVDVFLMLSGYFVGGSLWRAYSRGAPPRYGTYLARHARRLLPAAITVLAATAVAAVALLPITRWLSSAQQTLASLFYVENWYLATAGLSYGAANPDQSPWQHFWSLSIQGQYFLLLPLCLAVLAWLVSRTRAAALPGALLAGVVAATIASFVFAQWLVTVDQPLAYFHSFARLWEFLFGMLLAVLAGYWRARGPFWGLLAWVGLALVITTGFLVDGAQTFPGPETLLPVLGAGAVVVGGSAAAGPVRALLPLAPLGKYAYGFYLWHWPILVFAIVVRDRDVGWLAGSAVLVASALLAYLTYHLVELPVREGQPIRFVRPSWVARTVTAAGAVLVAASATWIAYIQIERAQMAQFLTVASVEDYPGALSVTDPGKFGVYPDLPFVPDLTTSAPTVVSADGCTTGDGSTTVRNCVYGDPDSPVRIALVGGSHAEHWFPALEPIATRNGLALQPYLKVGCWFADPNELEESNPECAAWVRNVLAKLQADPPDYLVATSTRPDPSGGDYVPGHYLAAFAAVPDTTTIVGLRDNAWFEMSMADCVAEAEDLSECSRPLHDYLSPEDPTADVDMPGMVFLDLNDVVCPDAVCDPVQGNRLVFSDSNHFTTYYAESLAVELERRMKAALGW